MSYLEKFSEEQLKQYEIVEDWKAFIKQNISPTSFGKVSSIYIAKKIFLVEDITFNREYSGDVTFHDCHFENGLSFGSSIFHKKFSIIDCSIEGGIWTTGTPTFHAGLNILKSTVDIILFTKGDASASNWEINSADKISIAGGTFTNLEISLQGKIGIIDIAASQISGDIFIDGNNREVDAIILRGTARKLSLFINNLYVNSLGLHLLVNENRLKLANLKSPDGKGTILISNSQLGKTEFSSIDFRKFQTVIFDESNLVESTFNNVTWSSSIYGAAPVNNRQVVLEVKRLYDLRSRETFRQLKYAMSKQGDTINEQKFHSIEMGYYFEMLDWKRDFWTKLIIHLSSLTSDFGQSIWRPLLFLLLFHSIFFFCLGLSGVFLEFRPSFSEFSIPAFAEGVNNFFYLINPIRPFDKILFHGGWIIIDLFMRISSSYMIYNIIRATRRFIK